MFQSDDFSVSDLQTREANLETVLSGSEEFFRVFRWNRRVDEIERFEPTIGRFISEDGIGNRWHYHSEIEITLVLSGSGIRGIGNSIETVGGRESLVLLGRGLPHYWKFSGPSSGICVQICDHKLRRRLSAPIQEEIRQLAEDAAGGIQYSQEVVHQIKNNLTAVLNSPQLCKLSILGLLLQTLGTLHSSAPETKTRISSIEFQPSTNHRHFSDMQNAISWIINHFQSPIQLEDVLTEIQMPKATFSRQFPKCTGLTFSQFVNELRLTHCCTLLLSTEDNISSIALDSGYTNLSNFNRQFVKRYGVKPSLYRKQNGIRYQGPNR